MTDRRNFPHNVKAQIIHRAMNSAGRVCCEGCGGALKPRHWEIDHVVAEALVIDKSALLTAKDGQLLGACCHRGENGKTAKDVCGSRCQPAKQNWCRRGEVMSDDLNAGFTSYLVEYSFGNATYAITIPARSWEEAQERIKRIGNFGRVIGSDAITIPASLGWLAKATVWWRNVRRQP